MKYFWRKTKLNLAKALLASFLTEDHTSSYKDRISDIINEIISFEQLYYQENLK